MLHTNTTFSFFALYFCLLFDHTTHTRFSFPIFTTFIPFLYVIRDTAHACVSSFQNVFFVKTMRKRAVSSASYDVRPYLICAQVMCEKYNEKYVTLPANPLAYRLLFVFFSRKSTREISERPRGFDHVAHHQKRQALMQQIIRRSEKI